MLSIQTEVVKGSAIGCDVYSHIQYLVWLCLGILVYIRPLAVKIGRILEMLSAKFEEYWKC